MLHVSVGLFCACCFCIHGRPALIEASRFGGWILGSGLWILVGAGSLCQNVEPGAGHPFRG